MDFTNEKQAERLMTIFDNLWTVGNAAFNGGTVGDEFFQAIEPIALVVENELVRLVGCETTAALMNAKGYERSAEDYERGSFFDVKIETVFKQARG
jgi:hypothetical protein